MHQIALLASQTSFSWWWLWHPLFGPGYQFWSGIASDLGELTLFTGCIAVYKQHNCKAHWWCPRLAKHKVDGTTALVCNHHHTREHHIKLQKQHHEKHPDRLGHGESVVSKESSK